jgi:hypothetical protein
MLCHLQKVHPLADKRQVILAFIMLVLMYQDGPGASIGWLKPRPNRRKMPHISGAVAGINPLSLGQDGVEPSQQSLSV